MATETQSERGIRLALKMEEGARSRGMCAWPLEAEGGKGMDSSLELLERNAGLPIP